MARPTAALLVGIVFTGVLSILAVLTLSGGTAAVRAEGQAQGIELATVASDGTQANQGTVFYRISAGSRYVAFSTSADNLVPGDTNGAEDVFVRDRQTGFTQRVSVATGGAQGKGESSLRAISADGRYVAFTSSAANLVPGDTNGVWDVFVRDRQKGTTERVSVAVGGAEADGDSCPYSITTDGRYVAFSSQATNLVEGDTNGVGDVFVCDRQTGVIDRVSVASDGAQAEADSWDCAMSDDGRYVAFQSSAANLVEGDTNRVDDIFVHGRHTGITERVNVNWEGAQTRDGSYGAWISADGRYVAFSSDGAYLVFGDSRRGRRDAFVHDRQARTTTLVSMASNRTRGNSASAVRSMSADGRYVAFVSYASNQVKGDTNGTMDVFVRDLAEGTTRRVNLSAAGAEDNGTGALSACLSPDGGFLAFDSDGTNLVPNDNNQGTDSSQDQGRDVFVVALDAAAASGTTGSAPKPTRYEETDENLEYAGVWYSDASGQYSGGAQLVSWGWSASVTMTFTGTSLEWIARTSPLMGKAWVSVDGGAWETVYLHSASARFEQRVWSTGPLSDGRHVVRIGRAVTANPLSLLTPINLDAVDVVGTLLAPSDD